MKKKNQGNNRDMIKDSMAWDAAYRKMGRTLPKRVMQKWVDHFDIVSFKEGHVTVYYPGKEDIEEFKENYLTVFSECISWAFGHPVSVAFADKKIKKKKKPSAAVPADDKKGAFPWRGILLFFSSIAGVLVLFFAIHMLYQLDFVKTFYPVASKKLGKPFRIVQLSDLGGAEYGEGNEELVKRIGLLQPDIIAVTGNMAGEGDISMAGVVELCQDLVQIAPVCYVYGDEEVRRSGMDAWQDGASGEEGADDLGLMLEAAGVMVLKNDFVALETEGGWVDVYGFLSAEAVLSDDASAASYDTFLEENASHFKLTLSHDPSYFEDFSLEREWGDLILCGSTLGGVVRMPKLGSVYDKEKGFFPELSDGQDVFIYGKYDCNKASLIVNGGLRNRKILRVCNRPEIAIVDITRY